MARGLYRRTLAGAALLLSAAGLMAAVATAARPHNRPVPILMYHVIAAAPAGAAYPDLFVPAGGFAREMTWLADHRHHAVTLRRLFHVPVDFFCYPSGRYDRARDGCGATCGVRPVRPRRPTGSRRRLTRMRSVGFGLVAMGSEASSTSWRVCRLRHTEPMAAAPKSLAVASATDLVLDEHTYAHRACPILELAGVATPVAAHG
jgi:hypothetical protein